VCEREKLADQIADWALVWEVAAARSMADSSHGMEWRHALGRWLAMSDAERTEWLARSRGWRMRNVHFDVGDPILQQDQPEWGSR